VLPPLLHSVLLTGLPTLSRCENTLADLHV
jgi:hypothetical protein